MRLFAHTAAHALDLVKEVDRGGKDMWPEKTVATWWEVDEEGTKTRGASRGGEDNGDMHGYGSVGDDATGGS